MGIPGFFGFIRKYNNPNDPNSLIKNKIYNQSSNTRQHFFLDFNGAIYTVNHKYKPKTEESLASLTLNYLDTLVKIYLDNQNNNSLTNQSESEPTTKTTQLHTLFIALDGVPPRAKIEQQRQRRFHSINQKNSQLKIDQKYGNNVASSSLDTNMITPGTTFMRILKNKLENHLKTSSLYQEINTVIFSSSDVPGEGEHKILDYIKKIDDLYDITNDNIIIYGLDADLIMLALISQKNNIYLLREKTEYGNFSFEFEDYKFLYLDINILKISILNEILPLIPDINLDIKNGNNNDLLICLINDYVFINFILGNDFIPKVPWFSISNNFNDVILYIYCRLYSQHRQFLINYNSSKLTINSCMVYLLFEAILQIEEEEYRKYYYKRQKKRINMRGVENEKERRDRLLKFFPLQHLEIEKVIDPRFSSWRDNYYKICFNMNYNQDNMDSVCKNYIDSIVWTFQYYFNGLINWDWTYKYHYAPTIKDVVEFLNREIQKQNLGKKKQNMYLNLNNYCRFTRSRPVTQQQLLLMVMPFASKSLMAKKYQELIFNCPNIKKYFPKSYKLSIPYHSFYWECKPILPFVDVEEIRKTTKSIKLKKDEISRNKVLDNFVISKN